MTPQDQNILNTLNLLAMLFNANKHKVPKLTDEELHTLTIKKEYLVNDNISLSILSNTLQTLANKGYLIANTIFDSEYHEKIREAFSDEVYGPAMKQLEECGKNLLTQEQKIQLLEAFTKITPLGMEPDAEAFLSEDVSIVNMFDGAREAFKNHTDDVIAKVVLMPFRDINKVLKQMDIGKSFDEILDAEFWYNEEKYEFYLQDSVISTAYQDKPNIEHYVLRLIPEHLYDGVIWYDEVEGRTSRSIKDALRKFVSKDKRLESIFKIHSSRLEFDAGVFV